MSYCKKLITFLPILILFSCQDTHFQKNKTIKGAAKRYFENWYFTSEGPTTDFRVFYQKNKDDIVETLEVSEIKKLKNNDFALAFIRFSVGTDIIRKGLWFHQINEKWYKTRFTSIEYKPSVVGLEKQTERFKTLLEEKEEWESNNPEKWWIEYL